MRLLHYGNDTGELEYVVLLEDDSDSTIEDFVERDAKFFEEFAIQLENTSLPTEYALVRS